MSSSLLVLSLCATVLCGVEGKAVLKMESDQQPNGIIPVTNKPGAELDQESNPCIYKGKIFTIDVTEVTRMFE